MYVSQKSMAPQLNSIAVVLVAKGMNNKMPLWFNRQSLFGVPDNPPYELPLAVLGTSNAWFSVDKSLLSIAGCKSWRPIREMAIRRVDQIVSDIWLEAKSILIPERFRELAWWFRAVRKCSTASRYAFKLIQMMPTLYRARMNPGCISRALWYASTASVDRLPLARLAPKRFHVFALPGCAMAAARKQSTALSYSEDRLKRTPSASWGGGAGNVIGFNGKFIKGGSIVQLEKVTIVSGKWKPCWDGLGVLLMEYWVWLRFLIKGKLVFSPSWSIFGICM